MKWAAEACKKAQESGDVQVTNILKAQSQQQLHEPPGIGVPPSQLH